jgi:hypothetical protein
MNSATMANGDAMSEAMAVQSARELHNNGKQQHNVEGHNAIEAKFLFFFFFFFSLVVSSTLAFVLLMLFMCSLLILDS